MEKINDMIQILEEKGRFKETKNFSMEMFLYMSIVY